MNFKRYVEASDTWVDSHYIKGTDTDTITTLPATIYPLGQTATIGLKGNTLQNGTPARDNPIMPEGTGDKTANLFDKDNTTIYNAYFAENGSWNPSTDSRSILIPVSPNTEYTLSISSSSPIFRIYETILDNPQPYSQFQVIVRTTDISSYTFTTGSNTKYIGFQGSGVLVDDWFNSLMLNLGSTALPYQPYGIKIPISCGASSETVYLGNTQSVRAIKKLVLDGTENWETQSGQTLDYFRIRNMPALPSKVFCTHYISPDDNIAYANIVTGIKMQQSSQYGVILACRPPDITNLNDFKTFLQQQYAAGTPVTVYYVLATPETATVNEPLQKIGSYSDSISGISLSVTAGANSLDVSTTVQPSEVSASFDGWHPVSSAHERSGGAWD